MEPNTLSLSDSPIKEIDEDDIPDPYIHCLLNSPIYIITHTTTIHLGKRKERDTHGKDKENIEKSNAKYKKTLPNTTSVRKPLQAIRV